MRYLCVLLLAAATSGCGHYLVPDLKDYHLGAKAKPGEEKETVRYCDDIELAAKAQSAGYLGAGIGLSLTSVGLGVAALSPPFTGDPDGALVDAFGQKWGRQTVIAYIGAAATMTTALAGLSFAAFVGANDAATAASGWGSMKEKARLGGVEDELDFLAKCDEIKSAWVGSREEVAKKAQEDDAKRRDLEELEKDIEIWLVEVKAALSSKDLSALVVADAKGQLLLSRAGFAPELIKLIGGTQKKLQAAAAPTPPATPPPATPPRPVTPPPTPPVTPPPAPTAIDGGDGAGG